jgi:hypothetical protein
VTVKIINKKDFTTAISFKSYNNILNSISYRDGIVNILVEEKLNKNVHRAFEIQIHIK